MTIRNRIAGYLFGEEVIAYKKPMSEPKIAKDTGIIAFNCDAFFRKFGGQDDGDNEIVGKLFGRDITCKESKEHPEIMKNVAFLSIHKINTEDWECAYCGCLRPKKEYKCDYCGARRTTKEKVKENELSEWNPDIENIGSIDV
jgi:hypothetical protein